MYNYEMTDIFTGKLQLQVMSTIIYILIHRLGISSILASRWFVDPLRDRLYQLVNCLDVHSDLASLRLVLCIP